MSPTCSSAESSSPSSLAAAASAAASASPAAGLLPPEDGAVPFASGDTSSALSATPFSASSFAASSLRASKPQYQPSSEPPPPQTLSASLVRVLRVAGASVETAIGVNVLVHTSIQERHREQVARLHLASARSEVIRDGCHVTSGTTLSSAAAAAAALAERALLGCFRALPGCALPVGEPPCGTMADICVKLLGRNMLKQHGPAGPCRLDTCSSMRQEKSALRMATGRRL